MRIYKRPGSKYYQAVFEYDGKRYQFSTHLRDKQDALDFACAKRTALVKGEVGIFEKPDAVQMPTVKEFLEGRFLPWVEGRFADKLKTRNYYRNGVRRIAEHKVLASLTLDKITDEHVSIYVAKRRTRGLVISSVNRELQVLRRALRLAVDWKVISSGPNIKMVKGETGRTHVISGSEQSRYLAAAPEPLSSIASVLAETGLRPEECFRLRWESITWSNGRHGTLQVTHGKTTAARRVIPMTPAVRVVLENRWTAAEKPVEGWIWPAPTRSGHAEPSTVRKQHAATFKTIAEQAAEHNQKPVREFVLYSFRHSFATRLGESGIDAWTLCRVMGWSNVSISSRYVHPGQEAVLDAVERFTGAEERKLLQSRA
jgi:integrase